MLDHRRLAPTLALRLRRLTRGGILPVWTHRTYPPPGWGRVGVGVNAALLSPHPVLPPPGGKGPVPTLVSPSAGGKEHGRSPQIGVPLLCGLI
jgi:hypothetical protein